MSLMEPRDLLDKYAVGQRLRGRVEHRAAFGVFVEVAGGTGGWSMPWSASTAARTPGRPGRCSEGTRPR